MEARALPIGGRVGGAKAIGFYATLLLLLLNCAPPAHSKEVPGAAYTKTKAEVAEQANSQTEAGLSAPTYSFWHSLAEQFKISSESEPELKSSVGFDFLTLFYGVAHRGFGLGLSYEKQARPHLAQKALFSATFMDTNYDGIYAIPFTVGYFAYFYPMSMRLNKLYAGLGGYIDYVSYTKSYSLSYGGVNFSAAAQAGYKILLPYNFMADVSLTYKMPVLDTIDAYGDLDSYINKKIQIGIGLKYTKLPELIRNVRNAKKSLTATPEAQTATDLPH